jgi:uncharacterized membrane protein
MDPRTAITVRRTHEETVQLWRSSEYHSTYLDDVNATVTFRDAPGDRGTEIHITLIEGGAPGGRVGEVIQELASVAPQAKVKTDLRRFKQLVETGEIARSDGAPEGETVERKVSQRPAQPVPEPAVA